MIKNRAPANHCYFCDLPVKQPPWDRKRVLIVIDDEGRKLAHAVCPTDAEEEEV